LASGDRHMLEGVRHQFEGVPRELLLTATAFIESGLNATRASKKLYIHRNTFNYRLQKFIEWTSLDIRDYHHAFYFRLSQINL
jgi:DNA-binding PucR family transcriptional regulator